MENIVASWPGLIVLEAQCRADIHESTGGDYVGSGGGTYHAKEYQKGFAIATPVV